MDQDAGNDEMFVGFSARRREELRWYRRTGGTCDENQPEHLDDLDRSEPRSSASGTTRSRVSFVFLSEQRYFFLYRLKIKVPYAV